MKLFQLLFTFCFLLCQITGCGSAPRETSPQVGSASSGNESIVTSQDKTTTPVATPTSGTRTPLTVFCAGSLIIPFAELERSFEAAYPNIDVLNECHGSIQVIRLVTELHEEIDVVATADHALIPMLMYTTLNPVTHRPYASWYVRFTGNRLALAYSPNSRYAAEINPTNWQAVIRRPDVKLGIADPRFDASGYRALMALKLAETYYQQKGIFNDLFKSAFRYPILAFTEDGLTEITVPEIVEPLPTKNIVIRGASIQLIALLESGDLDYAFEYESVIRQHQLKWVALPDAIHLGSENYAADYAMVQVKLDFQRFASVKPIFRGEPIGYGITIPDNAAHPESAREYISFLLSREGRAILNGNYQPVFSPPECDHPENMPAGLAAVCKTNAYPNP